MPLRFFLLSLVMGASSWPPVAFAQPHTHQQSQPAANNTLSVVPSVPSPAQNVLPPQPMSLAEIARQARAERRHAPKASMIFTNDNLPTAGGISVIGEVVAATETENAPSAGAASEAKGESYWGARFAALRTKLRQN